MKVFGSMGALTLLASLALVAGLSACSPSGNGDAGMRPDVGPPPVPDTGSLATMDAGEAGMEVQDSGPPSPCGHSCLPPQTCIIVNEVAMCGCDPDAGLATFNGNCVQNTCLEPNGCDSNASCTLYADAGHACTCNEPQYYGDGAACSINYCYNPNPPDGGSTANGTCPANSTCNNGVDAGVCDCNPGFALSGDGNQCLSETCLGLPDGGPGCQVHASCVAAPDQGQCVCNENFALDNDGGCDFVSICGGATPPTCPVYSHCDDAPDAGKSLCDCNTGYDLNGAPGSGDCSAHDFCNDTPAVCPSCTVCGQLPDAGTYECTPKSGYYLDAGSCDLINACGNLVCDTNATCVGTSCVCNADAGFHGSGTSCHEGYDRIALGAQHTCSITGDGELWCWGQQCEGQLGNGYIDLNCGNAELASCPVQVGTTKEWSQVAAGGIHTCAIQSSASDGDTLWCWGDNEHAQLGFTTDLGGNNQSFNTDMPLQVGSGTNWTKVAASNLNTCAIDNTGELWCWGDNTYGQLCNGTTSTPSAGISPGLTKIPVPVTAATGAAWQDVAMGDQHTCALLSDPSGTGNTLWCCGDDESGQIGTTAGDTMVTITQGVTRPLALNMTEVTNSHGKNWMAVGAGGGSAGFGHTCGIDITGTAWCWGDNTYGALGNGGSGNQSNTPVLVSTSPADMAAWVSIQSGPLAAHTCGIRSDNTLWCWGLNLGNGQVGTGSGTPFQTVPAEVSLQVENELTQVPENAFGVGSYFSCGIDADGNAWCWGSNSSGQLGNCSVTKSPTPTQTD